ncbi:MAG: MBOAT family O-acyltransferase, partial [Butyricicoccus sp.]
MIFNSIDFLIFFPVVTLLYFVLPRRVRWVWLLVASYYFYMSWNPRYAVLIALSTVITWLSGLLIARAGEIADERARTRRKKLWVAASFVSNLAILFFFKYYGFFAANVNGLFGLAGLSFRAPALDVVLPVGISFYTFQALGYTVDVYRGDIAPCRNLFRYALFVSFFPQLVAGPIERSGNLLHQLEVPHEFDGERARDGLLLMLFGLFQKVVVADRLAIMVQAAFDGYAALPGVAVLTGLVLFAFQIYCDFGGYSNIAIGAAQVLGVDLMVNFRQPYLSRSCGEFWRRWHISLSSWLRDYLYIPLGGSRCSKARKHFNLMVTFLASGLWHGASWSFVVWGGLNGLYQVLGEWLAPLRERFWRPICPDRDHPVRKAIQIATTFVLIDFAWLFFRSGSFRWGLSMLRHMVTSFHPGGLFYGGWEKLGLSGANWIVLLVSLGLLIAADLLTARGPVRPRLTAKPLPIRWAVYLAGIFAVLIFGVYGPGFSESQFIYFQ